VHQTAIDRHDLTEPCFLFRAHFIFHDTPGCGAAAITKVRSPGVIVITHSPLLVRLQYDSRRFAAASRYATSALFAAFEQTTPRPRWAGRPLPPVPPAGRLLFGMAGNILNRAHGR